MERMETIKAVFRLLNVSLMQAKILVDLSMEYAEGLDNIGDNERLTAIYCINAKDMKKLSSLIDDYKAKIINDQSILDYADYYNTNTNLYYHMHHAIFYSRIYKHVSCMK